LDGNYKQIKGLKDYIWFYTCLFAQRIYLGWDRQSKKQDLRSCRAGHSITKWNSVSTEFMQRLQVRRFYISQPQRVVVVGGNPFGGQPW